MSSLSPRLQMMAMFAAASLAGRRVGALPTSPASVECIKSAWCDAGAMMSNMPESVKSSLRDSNRAYSNGGNPYPDQG